MEKSKEHPNQNCARCQKEVKYNPRYPKYICRDCASLEKKDENGYLLTFSNVSMSGGLKVNFWKNQELIKEDTSQSYKICFIEGEQYIAMEAKFGGVVIQKMKEEDLI